MIPLEGLQGIFCLFIKSPGCLPVQVFQFLQPCLDPGHLLTGIPGLPDFVFFSHGSRRNAQHHQYRQNDCSNLFHRLSLRLFDAGLSRSHSVRRIL